ncbi:MAG: hypothetical protein ACNS62_02655 [Candidatus Cyclobacteriaceae bacterium M3_2C_046]
MNNADPKYFKLLKKDISDTLRHSYPEINPDISQWKVTEIKYFQDDLMQRINGRISQKWFYNHIKRDNDQFPRIDILNLLSQYVGFNNWEEYKAAKNDVPFKVKSLFWYENRRVFISLLGLLIILIIYGMNLYWKTPQTYQFCFHNMFTQQPVTNKEVTIMLLSENESPYQIKLSSEGCLKVFKNKEFVRFLVKGPYYRTDTITRSFNYKKHQEEIALKTNDYALMIHIFSNSNLSDWNKKRKHLDEMISDQARIFQIYDQNLGMAIFNKKEFIDKLTMPINSLRNIEVLETRYENDQIIELRFKQVTNADYTNQE